MLHASLQQSKAQLFTLTVTDLCFRYIVILLNAKLIEETVFERSLNVHWRSVSGI